MTDLGQTFVPDPGALWRLETRTEVRVEPRFIRKMRHQLSRAERPKAKAK